MDPLFGRLSADAIRIVTPMPLQCLLIPETQVKLCIVSTHKATENHVVFVVSHRGIEPEPGSHRVGAAREAKSVRSESGIDHVAIVPAVGEIVGVAHSGPAGHIASGTCVATFVSSSLVSTSSPFSSAPSRSAMPHRLGAPNSSLPVFKP